MNMPSVAKEAPPFVTFEYMEDGIDQEATLAAGRRIPKVTAFALIRQIGDKFTCTEKKAEEWLDQIEQKAIAGTYPPEWAQRYKMAFEQFKKGEELPREGTPVKTWPAPTREQVLRLLALGLTTVEDLAATPDQGLSNIGLDGRYLRDLAKNYVDSGKDTAGIVKKLADAEQSIRDKDDQIKRLEERMNALEANRTLTVPKK